MTRQLYGFRPSDFTSDAGGTPRGGVALTVWTQRTGGTQLTDLLTAGGSVITQLTSASDGRVQFQGPDGWAGSVWVDAGGGRFLIDPVDLSSRVVAAESALLTDVPARPELVSWDGTAFVATLGSKDYISPASVDPALQAGWVEADGHRWFRTP